jgi:hypothetical protein
MTTETKLNYGFREAMFFGNMVNNFEQTRRCWGEGKRLQSVLFCFLACIEIIPVISQIVSTVEYFARRRVKKVNLEENELAKKTHQQLIETFNKPKPEPENSKLTEEEGFVPNKKRSVYRSKFKSWRPEPQSL